MDLIDEKLTAYSKNHKYQPSICAAVGLAKKTLNQYYQLTDSSEVYCIAMGKCFIDSIVLLTILSIHSVLHPCHKLTYFKHAKWEDDWIETAEALVRSEFARSYDAVSMDADSDTDN